MMLGYITPDKPELKVKEYEMYSAYYCGICKAIKKRHGEIPRMVLSYDSVLLAMILSAIYNLEKGDGQGSNQEGNFGQTGNAVEENYPAGPAVKMERCIIHPVKKKAIVYNDAGIDYAADMLVTLAYYKFKDDWTDEKKVLGALGMAAFNNLHKKITGMYPETCGIINKSIAKLSELEKENCQSMDEAAEPFAQLMKAVFSGAPLKSRLGFVAARGEDADQTEAGSKVEEHLNEAELKSLLGEIGYNIGKWVYLIDAVDDLEKDLEKNRYNPLKGIKDDENYKSRVEFSLICTLENASLALKKLGLEKNKGIIENIIYFGLFKKTESIVGLVNSEDEKNIDESESKPEPERETY
ncbi:MAG: hypothetical protein JJE17_08800 [Peptostreptococcaceae bacterium]|nr:hypothetical protein [Peptostreptococcaceae bacterium]